MNRLARAACLVGLTGSLVVRPAVGAKPSEPAVVRVGAGSYLARPPSGAKTPPGRPFVTADFKGPVPTNDWCSSLYWEPFSHPHYAHPLAMKAVPAGLRVYYPGPAVAGMKDAIFGFMPDGKNDQADLTIGHAAVAAFPEKRVAVASDWFVDVRWQAAAAATPAEGGGTPAAMTLSYGHGSPFVYAAYEGGGARVTFAEVPKVWAGDATSGKLAVTVGGGAKHYALFAPPGAAWAGVGTKEWTCTFAPSGGAGGGGGAAGANSARIAVAVLPEATPEALDLFAKHAGLPVVDTTVTWAYDPAKAHVTTKLAFATIDAGTGRPAGGTHTALYPHQWRQTDAALTKYAYPSVRGLMKLAVVGAAASGTGPSGITRPGGFTTTLPLPGVLPALPRVPGGADPARLAAFLKRDLGPADDDPTVRDTYADGKRLGRWASLIPIAEQYGLTAEAEQLTKRVKSRLEDWLTATDAAGNRKAGRAFAYEPTWHTLIGYPASYGSDVELNDHHFHYGYFLRAAGEIARRDPAWAADERWGGMLKLIARDIASDDRTDPLFPFLRNFDPYAGHSWASGHARFGDGNNHESSSEAMNAWYGLLLLGQFTGDAKLRDLGAYLYATEAAAIEDYWFGVHGDTFAPGYAASVVTMVWGGKGANGTW
ncbi:MAG: Chitin binding protein, partial [Phycisphaerales bacterium]|nr:Chitin binding protein [Phycisphaerales bacterium]